MALRVAEELVDEYADGVCFVPLAPIREPELVVPTVARTLGIREAGARPLPELLKDHLSDKQLLLLLDNFAHVTEAGPIVTVLLPAYPEVKGVATSREKVHLSGGREDPLPPLAVPRP